MDMPDVEIGFSTADRERYWWRTGIVMLVLAGTASAVALTASASNRWWWVGGFGTYFLAVVFDMTNWIYGRALLTATGVEFRTFVSRRSIPWSEIAGIEKRQRVSRSGLWWDLRVVRVRGRALTIPGTLTNRMNAELEQKQALIQERWSRAVGG
ncbi:PH domain-containing protein [Streptomyces mirabilis]|jgi:hypothetical protein|uniref:PH domain-containing protein n=2 Tax=Streptomyces mirabilis TaxID=68239 RepID=UPI0033EECA65